MDTQPTRKELTHQRIVEVAARAIRRGGFQGVGVADIMKEAGLTHGGFYAHFPSRDALLVEALAYAGRGSVERMTQAAQGRRGQKASVLRSLVDNYLSETHLRSCEGGCPVAALASEMPRQAPEVREASAERVHGMVALARQALADDAASDAASDAARDAAEGAADAAIAIASQLVGALQLARALGDNAEGKALLAAARRSLIAHYAPAPGAA